MERTMTHAKHHTEEGRSRKDEVRNTAGAPGNRFRTSSSVTVLPRAERSSMDLRRHLTDRAVNALLLVTLVALAVTGIVSLFANAAQHHVIFEAHRVGAAV